MASCEQIKGLVQAYIDEELPQAERLVLERHLGECPACQSLLAAHKSAAAQMYEAYAPHRLRDSLCAAVMAHLPEMDTPRPMRRDSSYQMTPHPQRKRSRLVTLLPAMVSVALLLLGLAIAFSWPPMFTESGTAIGKVVHLEGKAHRANLGSTVRTDAQLGDAVYAGQRFITASNGYMMLALSGPTFMKLQGETRMKVRDTRSVNLESGQIWFDVAADGTHFQVFTPNGDVTVFGTEFDVHVDYDRTVVTVGDGEVQVENEQAFTVLRDNNQVVLTLGQHRLTPVEVDASALLSWADAIQPNAEAEKLFWAEINNPTAAGVMQGEQVFAVRTLGKPVSSILLEWKDDTHESGHTGYVVYVSDDKMEPLYRGVVDGALFDGSANNTHELAIDNGPIAGVDVLHIKVVPVGRDVGHASVFTGISAVSK